MSDEQAAASFGGPDLLLDFGLLIQLHLEVD